MSRSIRFLILVAVLALVSSRAGAADLATYRAFTLGTSTASVMVSTGSAPQDLKNVYERPAVLQELSWRPPYTREPDSLAGIVFSFLDDRLYRMVITYDRSRTEGLTTQDMITSLSAVYGPRSTLTAPVAARSNDILDAPMPIAHWRQEDTLIVLNQSAYTRGFGVVITAVKTEAAAKKAHAAAVVIDAREAPAREAARAKAEIQARQAAEEKTRATNRDAFKP
jgi:hypothetical protein